MVAEVFEVAQLLVDHVRNDSTVALVAYYGSHARGTATDSSDLDILFVADDPADHPKACAFVLDGLPYDYWAVGWQFLEDIADARGPRPWEVAASLVIDARVLHARSEQDLERFEAVQQRARWLTEPAGRTQALERAAECLGTMSMHLGRVALAVSAEDQPGLRLAAWQLVQSGFTCLALVNQTYFASGRGADLAEVLALPVQPPGLERLVTALTSSTRSEQVREAAIEFVRRCRAVVAAAREPEFAPPLASAFGDAHPGVLEYRLKIEGAAARGDEAAAAGAALIIQDDVARMLFHAATGSHPDPAALFSDYGRYYLEAGFPDLTAAAAAADLQGLASLAWSLDRRMRTWMDDHGLPLGEVADMDELRRLLGRSTAR